MKRIITTIIFGVLLVGLMLPLSVSAQPQRLNECCEIGSKFKVSNLQLSTEDGGCIIGKPNGACVIDGAPLPDPIPNSGTIDVPSDTECKGSGGDTMVMGLEEWGLICLVSTVYTVTNWIFYILMVIIVVMVVIGGATYMLAAGDPEKAGRGKKIIIYGIIGLAIALLARLIPSVVKLIVGMG